MPQYGTYTDLAPEYYDPLRHPTCANFREASGILLVPWLRKLVEPDTRILEVGAGRSIVGDWLLQDNRASARFVATDLSWEMLRHSRLTGSSQNLVVSDAQQLPFSEESFDLIVSSLGDPYNTPSYWHEMARILRNGGYILFSTPSSQWAHQFRNGEDAAEFSVVDGRVVAVKSYIEPPEAQRQLIERFGLKLIQCGHVNECEVYGTPHSPKLRPGPIVSLYVSRKPSPRTVL